MSLGHRLGGRGLHTIGTGPVHPACADGYGGFARRGSRAIWKRSCCRCPAWLAPWSLMPGEIPGESSGGSRPTAGRPVRDMSHGRGARAVGRPGRYGHVSRSAESIECGSRDALHCLAGRLAPCLNPTNGHSVLAGQPQVQPPAGGRVIGAQCAAHRPSAACLLSAASWVRPAGWRFGANGALLGSSGTSLALPACPCADFVPQYALAGLGPARRGTFVHRQVFQGFPVQPGQARGRRASEGA
jgi:hypothetical protein